MSEASCSPFPFRNLPSAMQHPEDDDDVFVARPLPTSETNVTLLFDDDLV